MQIEWNKKKIVSIEADDSAAKLVLSGEHGVIKVSFELTIDDAQKLFDEPTAARRLGLTLLQRVAAVTPIKRVKLERPEEFK